MLAIKILSIFLIFAGAILLILYFALDIPLVIGILSTAIGAILNVVYLIIFGKKKKNIDKKQKND